MMWYKIKTHLNIFSIISILSGVLILLPLLGILFELTSPATPEWNHIKTYLLKEYIINSVVLVLLVATFSILIGLFAAYVIARYQFKGRNVLAWLLVLPLAIPSYIAGYIYADMTSYTGTFSIFLRNLGILHNISIMNLFGASLIFSLTLYPYVYILTLSSLPRQSANYLDSAKLLGSSSIRSFFTVTLPLLRPALVAGSLLVILETLNDYGLVQYFNIRVFSFAIFNAWFSLGDVVSAIRLSAFLMLTVFFIILLERALRGKKKYHMPAKSRFVRRIHARGWPLVFIVSGLSMILLLSFLFPVAQMIYYLVLTIQQTWDMDVLMITLQTITNGMIATIIILIIAIFMVNFNRMKRKNRWSRYWTKVSNLGYAIPGAVIAVAVHLFFVDLDRFLSPLYRLLDPNSPTLVITMSVFTLIFAYVLRFLSIGFNSVESQYEKVGDRFTESSYMLGYSRLRTLLKVDLPMIYPGLVSAMILVFIDVIKELPLTLILRPTNYDSLATLVYVYTSNEMIQEASLPSLILILMASTLIYLITHFKKGVFSHVY
ncbi:MAG: iron ABC transporter permease [Acholeplasma sp.]|nr:MAG: iron ABC transporter permease [Acholeplasma sp.]